MRFRRAKITEQIFKVQRPLAGPGPRPFLIYNEDQSQLFNISDPGITLRQAMGNTDPKIYVRGKVLRDGEFVFSKVVKNPGW